MINKLHKLHDHIYNDESTKDPNNFIKIVNPSIEVFEFDFSKNHDNYVKVTRLLADYAMALSNAGYLKKSIPFFDKAIHNMRNDTVIKEKDLPNEPLYEALMFHRGITNYNLKKYRESKPDFKFLVDNFTENDKYKNWYNGAIKMIFKNLEWTFFSLIIISTLGIFIFDKENRLIDIIALSILIISLISSITVEFIKKRQMIK